MDIDTKIAHVKELIQRREEIDGELAGVLGATLKTRKILRCSRCGEEGHNAKTCSAQPLQPDGA